MNNNLISFIVGYVIVINLIGISLIWLKAHTEFIKIGDRILSLIYILISIIGGFIGVLVGAEMMDYKQDNKLFRRWIPFLVFVEVCIGLYFAYQYLM